MKMINQVFVSKDYSLFKGLIGNRVINKVHVKRLVESFKKNYLFSPILVNEKYEIIDGQHRFEAAKELKLPIYFTIITGYGLYEVQVLNENMRNWGKEDYLNAYCDLGYSAYLNLKVFMGLYPEFSLSVCEAIFMDSPSGSNTRKKDNSLKTDTNKSGSYSVRTFEEGKLEDADFDKYINVANKIMRIKPYYDGFSRLGFVRAMINIFKLEYYDHNILLSKLNLKRLSLHDCYSVTDYRELIEKIYNYRNQNPANLRINAKNKN